MRIHTPINKEQLRHHWNYNAWKYLLMVVLTIFGWSLIYTTTAYRSPQDKRIDLYVMTATATQEKMDAFMKPIWEEVTPDMETVSSVVLSVGDEYTSYMQLTTYIFAGDGDIYFITKDFFESFASQGAFLPLDDLVADGTLDVGDVDLKKGYVTQVLDYEMDANGLERPIMGERHLYGIPLDSFYGFMEGMQLDNRGLYAVVLAMNQNDENVIPFFNALLQAGRGEKEAWITE